MKQLKDILYKVNLLDVIGSTAIDIQKVTFDSRQVEAGCLFVAVSGTQVDGHHFIQQAIDKGAKAILCEQLPNEFQQQISYIRVQNSARALAFVAENFYDNPSEKLKIVAVTGTNGKTTTATLLYRLFRELGYSVGLLSTVENKINEATIPATHTTPDPIQLSSLLADMVDAGCEYAFMEASSHAIHQHRVAALQLTGAVFTNITHDHLDYHGTFDAYIAAKKQLFDELPASAFALVNLDDKRGRVMVQNTKGKVQTYSLSRIADFKGRIIESSFSGLIMDVDGQELYTKLIGEFNAYNVMAIYAVAVLLGIPKVEALGAISQLNTAEGRFDYISTPKRKIIGIVDYAHTPDALKKVLDTIKAIRTGNEQLITVVGCGGNRDREKRPLMARIASELSNKVVLTSDNPRNEEPEAILDEMYAGLTPNLSRHVLRIVDRKEAIRTACQLAGHGDIILLAGKGHEKYQEIKGVKYPFDDKQILAETLNALEN
ncbi:MAG: UDP-N-acetylmuramoyl-L-alanyl-D-glutamate--2,6-diaminopimelate ligase [Chitinophagales bacterium]|nr:UDP-N-acetylmuramoyl-L-alanyl-D-glutamate--2,6-diaminopimelate ligase [Chitinophagales bacterium]